MEMTGIKQKDERLTTDRKPERYWYANELGDDVFCVERYYDSTGNKRFRQSHWCGGKLVTGMGESCNCNDIPRLLFNLEWLLKTEDTPVVWVEGEKDVQTLAGMGIVGTCTPQGSQSFAKCLASNPKVLEPLRDREVIVIADNDAPGRKYANDVADRLVEYADKVWLAEFGDEFATGYDISDHVGLGNDAKAWMDANKRLLYDKTTNAGEWGALPTYDTTTVGDVVIYHPGLEVWVMRIDKQARALMADIRVNRVYTNGRRKPLLPSTNLNLMSSNARSTLAGALKKKHPDYEWGDILDGATAVVEVKIASDVDVVDVYASDIEVTDRNWLWEPIIGGNEHVVIYAQGGVGKSLLAGAGVLSVATGKPFIHGTVPHAARVPSLYLDWEDNEEAYVTRLRRMASGAGVVMPEGVCHYASMVYPLEEQLDTIRRLIDSKGIELVVIDSVGTAMGGDITSSHTALRYQRLVQSLQCSVLSITHVSKETKKNTDKPDAIGSVYFMNGPRSAFFLAGDASIDLGAKEHVLVHTKSNSGNIQRPIGYKIDYGNHTGDIVFAASSPYTNIHLRKYCELVDTLEYFLAFQYKTIDDLVMELPEVKRTTIEKWLNYYKGKKFSYNLQDDTWTTM